MSKVVSVLERALVFALASVPAILASSAVRDFISAHPGWAIYVPLVASVCKELYDWLKPQVGAKLHR